MIAKDLSCPVEGCASHPFLVQLDGSEIPLAFFADFAPGTRVLDVGCGEGTHLRELVSIGCEAVGLECDTGLVEKLQAEGKAVLAGQAEHLPFADSSFDAIICSVVVPYTDERKAVAEWARVVRPNGRICVSYHGIGYGLDLLLNRKGLRRRFYGLRMLANTIAYRLNGRRLPGYLGILSANQPRS